MWLRRFAETAREQMVPLRGLRIEYDPALDGRMEVVTGEIGWPWDFMKALRRELSGWGVGVEFEERER